MYPGTSHHSHSPTLPLSILSLLCRLDMDNVITMDGQVSDWAICRVTPIQIRNGCGRRQVMMNIVLYFVFVIQHYV